MLQKIINSTLHLLTEVIINLSEYLIHSRVSFKNFFSVAQSGYHLTKLSSLRENLVAQLEKKRCLILNIF